MHIWLIDRSCVAYRSLVRRPWLSMGAFVAIALAVCLAARLLPGVTPALLAVLVALLAAAFLVTWASVRSTARACRVVFVRDAAGRLFLIEASDAHALAALWGGGDSRVSVTAAGHDAARRELEAERTVAALLKDPAASHARAWQVAEVVSIAWHERAWDVTALVKRVAGTRVDVADEGARGVIAARPRRSVDDLADVPARRRSFTVHRVYFGQDELDRALTSRMSR